MKIFINASEVAALIGKNKFKSSGDILYRIWEKYFYHDIHNTILRLKEKSVKVIPKETDEEVVNRITKESGADLKNEMKKCMNTKDVNKLRETKKDVINKIEKSNISREKKNEFKKSLENVANTNFGTINERDILQEYMLKTNNNATTNNTYYKKKIGDSVINDEVIEWFIIGKVDALVVSSNDNSSNTVIEIKNRIYRYFKEVREYEKIQTFVYMFLLGYRQSHLVEALKDKKCDINIIEINYDDDYWKEIVSEIKKFIDFFSNIFMNNIELKEEILL